MSNIHTSRQKLNGLAGQRAQLLNAAQDALNSGNTLEYKAKLEAAKAMNSQIDELQGLCKEFDRYDIAKAPVYDTSDPYDLKDMGERLKAHERVSFSPQDIRKAIGRPQNGLTWTGQIVQPTGGGSEIHDGFNAQVSTLIDQVRVEDFTGLTSWEEPYLKSIQEAQGGSIAEVSGKPRAESDATFRKAKITATEMSVTSLVDKNIADLSPAAYAAKVQQHAMTALRRLGVLDAEHLRGSFEEVAANARLVLNKKALYAFGQIKLKTGDNRKLYEITQNGNTGTIKEGGLTVPYILASKCGDNKLLYGDPMQYLMGLFGVYSIRIDESVKSLERMIAILGDVKVGGNLVSDKAFAVATLAGG